MAGCCNSSKLLFILPLVACMMFPVTFGVSYGVAVLTTHVQAEGDFPYISETGTKPPESCIFGQLLNIAAVIVGFTIYVRFLQVREALDCLLPSVHIQRLNGISAAAGFAAAFGVSMVGNFQMDNLLVMHLVGAALAFILGTIYTWLQCVISFHLLRLTCSRPIFGFRVILSIITTIFLGGTILGAYFFESTNDQNKSLRWFSTSSEWLMALAMAVTFATFASEFKYVKIRKPKVTVKTTFII